MSQHREDSEGESEMDETIIGAAGGSISNPPAQRDNLAALVDSIAALRESVVELRNDTNIHRSDLQQLRERISRDDAEMNPPPSTSNESVNRQVVGAHHRQSPESVDPPQLHTLVATNQPRHPPTFMDSVATRLYPLPNFEGCPEDCPLFIACYRDTTAEFNYNNRQNLIRLQKALRGEARRTVMSLLIYPDNVPSVISELEFNFGRPELLVRSQLQKVQNFPHIAENRLDQILDLASKVRNIVAFFKSARCDHHLVNPTLLDSLITKLPPSKQFEWSKRAAEINTYPTVECFANWLSDLARVVALMPRVAERSTVMSSSRPVTQASSNTRASAIPGGGSRRVLHTNEVRRQQQCVQCNQDHKLTECREFSSHSVNERWALVKRHLLCFGCLTKGHNLLTCRQKLICGISGCQRKHHRMLHASNEINHSETNSQVERVYNCRQEEQCTLFKILPVTLIGPRGKIDIYAMFDEGSSISLIDEKIANSLGLPGQTSLLSLQWYGQNKTVERSRKVSLEIRSPDAGRAYAIKNSAPVPSYTHAKPELLLGLDNSFLGIAQETVCNGPSQLIAAKTMLGWMTYGPSQVPDNDEARVMVVRELATMKELHKLVEDYITGDTLVLRPSYSEPLVSDEDSRAKKILAERTNYIGSRYEVGLLWKNDDIKFPPSYSMALKRLLNIESKMKQNSQFANSYTAEINKYVSKGYARQLPLDEATIVKPTTWYLPHFGVVNAHKPKKLRIVFDAAAVAGKMSLNQALLTGPEKAQSLLTILFKFREGAIAVAGDIEEMFSQVCIRADDQDAQRFLWRDGDSSKPIRTYVMTSLIFGATCSPCCAEYVKNINAARFSTQMPQGFDAVTNKTYVDDLVISFPDAEEAEQTIKEAIEINAAAGFKLRKFVSNCETLQKRLNTNEDHQSSVINLERQAAVEKILGMFWNTKTDAFEYHFKFFKISRDILNCKRPPTKRELLGLVMSIYDPFGFLANVTIFAKLLLQSLWKQGVAWDEPLPPQLEVQWKTWWRNFQSVKSFSIARCYSKLIPNARSIQLHIFVDASTSAYAAVGYLRVQTDNAVKVALVFAKSICAPLKVMTVPRLELQAAVLGCRLKSVIMDSLDIKIDSTFIWSDSKTVILWIRSHTRSYKPFVAHRISEILSTTTTNQWRWVPTALNVADDATRATPIAEFATTTRWLTGPPFLHQDEGDWPRETVLTSDECVTEEIKKQHILICQTSERFINYTKFSSFLKLVRVIAWSLRFISNIRRRNRNDEELQVSEIINAEKVLFTIVQNEAYSQEIELLRNKVALPKNNSLYALTPYLDDEGLLRVYGRIDAAYCLPMSARRPIILPPDNYVTKLIVADHHRKRHHQNENLTINEIRQRYWIPAIRKVLKLVKKDCSVCIQNSAKPAVPLMGQLPVDRLTPYVRPFTYSGVDYCGPFHVAIGRRREKRWIALFTCMTTRAVHLELSESLSTDSFIICLRNFVNRRGVPVRIRSDNGTNFVGAQKEMNEAERMFDFNAIRREMSKQKIEWVFNCPADPESGGCWERLIQCTKRLLHRILKEEAPRVETLRSVIIEIENIINSRPLTDLPISSEDDEPLTPNHFLVGCLNSTQTPHPEEERLCLRKQWKIAQNLKDRAWKRWTLEYLPRLLCRPKWRDEAVMLKPGTLVIICDPSTPRSRWEKGKITNVFQGSDGRSRSANVQTAHGIIRRPIRRLAALQVCESTEDPPGGGMLSN